MIYCEKRMDDYFKKKKNKEKNTWYTRVGNSRRKPFVGNAYKNLLFVPRFHRVIERIRFCSASFGTNRAAPGTE